MRDVIDMWRNTRMVVLTAMSASLFAAILIPFKVLPIIPGVTEFRPANAVPVVCSFLFGPAAAWGAAIGNLIGDFFGGIGPGDLFGFVGNFLYGFLPYKAWEALTDAEPVPRSVLGWAAFVGVLVIACGACALVIAWGINLLGFVPFRVLANLILLNNFAVAVVLAPFLLAVIYPRVRAGRLLYRDVMPPPARSRRRRRVALAAVALLTLGGLVVGNLLSSGALTLPVPGGAHAPTGTGALEVGVGLLPIILALFIAAAFL